VIAALALAPAIWFLEPMRRDVVGWFAALAVVVIWLHRANIKRLARGTENRFGRSRGAAA
jgi:glycerol-3-phosphate acyltransferase PlsY